jgi:hypothetical protein
MKLLTTIVFILITVCIYAQKIESTTNNRTSDFTTTPFQDGSAGSGVKDIFSGFNFIEEDTYNEGDVKVLVPMTFNPNAAPFKIDGNIAVLKLCVYDMEGNKVFEEKSKNIWNGIDNKGSKVRDGLYIYTVEGRITPGKTSKFAGFVKIKSE